MMAPKRAIETYVVRPPLRGGPGRRPTPATPTKGWNDVILEELYDGSLLNDAFDRLGEEGLTQVKVHEAMDELFRGLQPLRLNSSDPEWDQFVTLCMRHPLREILHQDPFTLRAFDKPRGYAGDATLLDMIYAREENWPAPEGTTELGRMLLEYTTGAPAPESVRARRRFIAGLVDRLADEVRQPHILSAAAGHLREAALSGAVKGNKIGRYVVLDWDMNSLEEVDRSYARYGVEVAPATIRQLLAEQVMLGTFDCVYAAGLLDYLPQHVAQRLTRSMFLMLRPGGQLLVANYLPEIRDVGYMESYMAWKLVYRSRQEMLGVADGIPEADIRDIRMFTDEQHNLMFLHITRR
jgi:SAM-dependent methyltransferase